MGKRKGKSIAHCVNKDVRNHKVKCIVTEYQGTEGLSQERKARVCTTKNVSACG